VEDDADASRGKIDSREALKERVEGPVLAYQHCIGCKRLLEEIEAN